MPSKKVHFSRLLSTSSDLNEARELTEQVLTAAKGIVVEVGIGSALDLAYYSSNVVHPCGIDASSELLQMTRQKTEGIAFPVTLLNHTVERIPLENHSRDTVVMTWVLCSIAEDLTALREMKRVLKPDGRLLFLEHGFAPELKIQSWQNRLAPIWKRIGGGCWPNNKIDELISRAGFAIRELRNSHMPGPKPMA
ncbi:MAG: class I SAM-dependent methyltransferase [Candidatus Acidiferrales bacterium]